MSLIRTKNLVKLYDMGVAQVVALNGVTIDIEEGEFVAIMGPSGSGKSTLMNLIGCLDTPSNGSYLLKGEEVSRLDDNQLAAIRNREIGFIFQTFNLLPRTDALHNVELPLIYSGMTRGERKEKAMKALEAVGLKERMHHKPNEMSGGERQRVAIARALVNQPSIILADEPTGNLDSKTGEEIISIIVDLNERGHTIILVTHEEYIAKKGKRIIKLFDGKVVDDQKLN
ncbi:MAG: ABC transporter ATP-binding protein [Acidobacteriota bacterium]